tara:strand:+ start:11859 stop:12830 length:972 start_codon:yes stop_codon:yes gene_type:complete
MKVLLIKLSSMGDLMHAFPAISEASSHYPDIQFDWVVDTNFGEVPSWHPNVRNILISNHRNWKKQLFSISSLKELKILKNEINAEAYDFVIDMQNNIKSAFISYLYKGEVFGMDKNSVREYPAHWAYSKSTSISKELHAIQRQNILMSRALEYKPNKENFNYGVDKTKFTKPKIEIPEEFVVIVQNASWHTKLWSKDNWRDLILYIEKLGFRSLLTSGNLQELDRASEITRKTNAIALDLMSLNEISYIINEAKFCVCSDTGLAHLSALVGTPSITLYGPTNKDLIGTMGANQYHVVGENKKMENILLKDIIKKIDLLGLANL